eukprot:9975816-Lingulodinium_polyedra.AAC.1
MALPAEAPCARAPASPGARRAARWRRTLGGAHGHALAWHAGGLWCRSCGRRTTVRGVHQWVLKTRCRAAALGGIHPSHRLRYRRG